MTLKKTLGGDRLGSGNRMKQELHNFYRSNHNLSVTRSGSMAPGVLYPMYVQMALKGDTFDINANAFVRTIPTQGPLFGSFKLQVDFFQYPIRLAQAILHNNTTEIGMEMNKVLFPKVKIETKVPKWNASQGHVQQISRSCLMYYLGLAGIGRSTTTTSDSVIARKFNAVPMIAYYDIFKNYYANKQEEMAYVLTSNTTTATINYTSVLSEIFFSYNGQDWQLWNGEIISPNMYIKIEGANLLISRVINVKITDSYLGELQNTNTFYIDQRSTQTQIILENVTQENLQLDFAALTQSITTTHRGELRLQEFELANIDQMRKRLLTYWDLGTELVIDKNESLLPYQVNTKVDTNGYTYNVNPMNGLVVKTYQSDMFNNWLDNEWVDKITSLSSVSTSGGSFTIDALNFAKKVWELYNRIAISGGTYDDWQEAVYGDKVWGKSEKPMYCGGMSAEVMFDEVVSSAATADQPLGTIGGRGSIQTRKGGNVVIKVNEASFIMAIVSLTPRICYTQGNAWYLTELDSVDDLHKPNLDRIGFQDLLLENMAWWDTKVNPSNGDLTRKSAGKQPAWIHYMTDVNKCYADFAEEDGKGFMVLQRLYDENRNGDVADVTTYIQPKKYNYAFANAEIDAQNFWTFLDLDIKARRKMSASQIPNL